MTYADFKNAMKKGKGFGKAKEALLSGDPRLVGNARSGLEANIQAELGNGVVTMNDPDSKIVRFADQLGGHYSVIGMNEFMSAPAKYVADAIATDAKALAAAYLTSPAIEINGNDKHNEVVELHQRYSTLTTLMNEASAGTPSAVKKLASGAMPIILEDVEARLANKYADPKIVKSLQGLVAQSYATSSPQILIGRAGELVGTFKKGIDAALSDDKKKLAYVGANLAQLAKGKPEEQQYAAQWIANTVA